MKHIAALLCLFLIPVVAKAAEKPEPFMLLRALQDMQNRIAVGDVGAQTGQGELVAEIGAEFERVSPETWKDPRNVRALAIYLFSGGAPGPVRRLLAADFIPHDSVNLLRGALAYGEGRQTEARTLLMPFDPLKVPASFGGHLALIQGALLARTSPEQALASLDIARLLAPGSLVEETALRRSAFVAAQIGNLDLFATLGNRYLRRFPKSVYGRDFRERLPAAVASFTPKALEHAFPRVVTLIGELSQELRRSTYLAVARQAVMSGNVGIADSAASLAMELTAVGSVERTRAELYRSVGGLLGPNTEKAIISLATVQTKGLEREDRELLAAARYAADMLRPSLDDAPALPVDKRPAPTESMLLAMRALEDSEKLLQAGQR